LELFGALAHGLGITGAAWSRTSRAFAGKFRFVQQLRREGLDERATP